MKNCKKLEKVGNSGEKWLKVAKSCEKFWKKSWKKWGKVAKSGE